MSNIIDRLKADYTQLKIADKEITYDTDSLRKDYLLMRKYITELEDMMEVQDKILSLIPQVEYDKALNKVFPLRSK